MKEKFVLHVPASTSNLGPGFDTLGLALSWYLTLEVKRGGGGCVSVELDYDGLPEWKSPLLELINEALAEWEKSTGLHVPAAEFDFHGDVPIARGLGSSAVYRLAAAAGANILAGQPLDQEALLTLVSRLEKHPDNAAASLLGGLTIAGWNGSRLRYFRCPMPEDLRLVALVPETALETEKARKVLPEVVPREDAVFNLRHALWLLAALLENQPHKLRDTFHDRLHQPYRQKLLPFLPPVIAAAEEAGAYGGFLSGAGSTVIAVAGPDKAQPVAQAMLEALEEHQLRGFTRVLFPDNHGMRVEP